MYMLISVRHASRQLVEWSRDSSRLQLTLVGMKQVTLAVYLTTTEEICRFRSIFFTVSVFARARVVECFVA